MRNIGRKFYVDNEGTIRKTKTGESIPHSEPLFLVRARDHVALPLLLLYRDLCQKDGCNKWQLEGIEESIEKFAEFAKNSPDKMKQPGITKGE